MTKTSKSTTEVLTPNRSRRSKLPRTCRSGPPKHYPKDRKKYALPECWMYPVHDRPHVRKAAQRFGQGHAGQGAANGYASGISSGVGSRNHR